MHGKGAWNFPNTLRGIGEELTLSEPFVKGLELKPIALYISDLFSPLIPEFLQTSNSGLSFDFPLGEKSS